MKLYVQPSLLCIFALAFPVAFAQIYTAVFRLKGAFEEERKTLVSTKIALGKLTTDAHYEPGVKEFKRFIEEAASQHVKDVERGAKFMEHPINVFHFITRMTKDWPKNVEMMAEADDPSVQKLYETLDTLLKNQTKWPSEEDRKGVITQLGRAQAIYLLDIHQLATGSLNGTNTDPLTLDEVFDIARFLYDKNMFYEAVLWYRGLLKEIKNGGKGKEVTLLKATRGLAAAYLRFGNFKRPIEVIETALKAEPDNPKLQADLEYYKQKLKEKTDQGADTDKTFEPPSGQNPLHDHLSPDMAVHKYFAMCRGDVKKPESYKKKLKCRFKKTSIPYRPAKLEIMNLDPMVVVFHDVIYDSEVKVVKDLSKPLMYRSVLMNTKGQEVPDDIRISNSAWLDDSKRLLAKLGRRVEEKTGLRTRVLEARTEAEDFQVLNYGLGGMYEPHVDYFGSDYAARPYVVGSGDRFATWMFYVNDVDAGGATVFPKAEAYVPVTKGSAVFWLNFFLNGTADARTLHAGCPTSIGSKWVMNKWIHVNAQFDRWRCSKRRYARTPSIYLR